MEAQQQGNADSHITVTGEVAINLQGIAINTYQILHPRIKSRIIKNTLYKVNADIFLPVGISFFTFQSLSYTIDVYRRQITPLTSLLDYAFYVSFFPQLVAGPIVRARDFIPQIRRPLFVSNEMFGRGIFLIVSGLFKKAVISDL